jgi:hypothetical protein
MRECRVHSDAVQREQSPRRRTAPQEQGQARCGDRTLNYLTLQRQRVGSEIVQAVAASGGRRFRSAKRR